MKRALTGLVIVVLIVSAWWLLRGTEPVEVAQAIPPSALDAESPRGEIDSGEAHFGTDSEHRLDLPPGEDVQMTPEERAALPVSLSVEVLELTGNQLHVKGWTDRGATVTVNGERLTVQRDGSFDEHVAINLAADISIRATGLDGGRAEQRVPIRQLLVRPSRSNGASKGGDAHRVTQAEVAAHSTPLGSGGGEGRPGPAPVSTAGIVMEDQATYP